MTPQPPRSPPHQTAPTLLMTKKTKIIMNVFPMNQMDLQRAPVESRTHLMVDLTKMMEMKGTLTNPSGTTESRTM